MQENAVNNIQFVSPNVSPNVSPKRQDLNRQIAFTDKSIRHLHAKEKRQTYWFDGMTGFGVRVTPKGTKSFIYTYRVDGQQRMLTIGQYPKISLAQARVEYAKAAEKVIRDEDPAETKLEFNQFSKENPTVKEMVSKYVEYAQKTGKKTWQQDKRTLERDVIPFIGHMRVHKVKRRHISTVINLIVERGSIGQASHTLAYIMRMFNIALQWGYVEFNPCQGIKKISTYKPRERVLTPKEIWKFWHGLERSNLCPVIKLTLRHLLCTMTRTQETRLSEWQHFDILNQLWIIPEELAKNGHAHRLPLNRLATDNLKAIKAYTGASRYTFGSTRHQNPPEVPPSGLKPLTKCALSRAIALNREEFFNIEKRFTPHDLRRTGATYVVALGCPVDWAERLLNHEKGTLIRVYNRYSYELEKRTGTEILCYALERIIACCHIDDVPSLETLRKEVHAKGLLYKHFSFGEPMKSVPQRFEAHISGGITYQMSSPHHLTTP